MNQETINTNKELPSSFVHKGHEAPNEWFTGKVWVNLNVVPTDNYNVNIGTVTFEPKARTNWHSHLSGQILFVIEGTGYYQEKGKPMQLIQKGDVVQIPKNVLHWHGASHESSMRHIAIIPDLDKDKTEWFSPVKDAEFDAYMLTCKSPSKELISAEAFKNHEALWPNYISTLALTDPELITVFDNFAFDEVLEHDTMPIKMRVLIVLASTIGSQALTEFRMYAQAALNIGITPIEIKEVVYQAVPYAGISKVVDFLSALNELFTSNGIALPLEGQAVSDTSTRIDLGIAVLRQVIGDRVDQMYDNSPDDLNHIQKYLVGNCFGDYMTRNGLTIQQREMITLSFLIAMGGTESQMKGHIQGNLNVGNDRQTLINLMTQLLPYVGYPRTLNALNCLNEVLPTSKK